MKAVRSTFMFILKIVIVFAVFFFIIGFWNVVIVCPLRDTQTPHAPLYEGSTLVSQATVFNTNTFAILEYKYETQTDAVLVADFYSERATTCSSPWREGDRIYCYGDAAPFGVYNVYIDPTVRGITTYIVELRWDKCGGYRDWDTISVER